MKKIVPIVCAVLFLTACNQEEAVVAVPKATEEGYQQADKSQPANQPSTAEAVEAVEAVSPAIPKIDHKSKVDNAPLTVYVTAQWFKTAMVTQTLSSMPKQMSEKTVKCLMNGDYTEYVVLARTLLGQQLTDKELAQAESFYNSDVGKKSVQLLKDNDLKMADKPVANPTPPLTDDEQKAFDAFNGSPVAQKIASIADYSSFRNAIPKLANQEMTRCQLKQSK